MTWGKVVGAFRRGLGTSGRRRERIEDPCEKPCQRKPKKISLERVHGGSARAWRSLSLFVGIPLVVVTTAALFLGKEAEERPPFAAYDYLRIRNKKFPWGDGDSSFFHNPKKNALTSGYQEDDED